MRWNYVDFFLLRVLMIVNRGFALWFWDIPCNQVIKNPTECENRCMQLFLTQMERVTQDPRCPVEVIQKSGEFTLTYNYSIPSIASLSSLDLTLLTSTSVSISPEDSAPFGVFSTSVTFCISYLISSCQAFTLDMFQGFQCSVRQQVVHLAVQRLEWIVYELVVQHL